MTPAGSQRPIVVVATHERSRPLVLVAALVLVSILAAGSDAAPGDPMPDLRILDLQVVWQEWGEHQLRISIANEGGAFAPSTKISVASSDQKIDTQIDSTSIGPNSQIDLIQFTYRTFYGLVTFDLQIDPDGQLAEADEANNAFSKAIDFAKPQLSISYQPENRTIRSGETVKIGYLVSNRGPITAKGVHVRLADGTTTWSTDVPVDIQPDYAVAGSLPWTAGSPGTYPLTLTVDPTDSLPESDETDNNQTFQVSVAQPAPVRDLSVEVWIEAREGPDAVNAYARGTGDHDPSLARFVFKRDGVVLGDQTVDPTAFQTGWGDYSITATMSILDDAADTASAYEVTVSMDPDTAWQSTATNTPASTPPSSPGGGGGGAPGPIMPNDGEPPRIVDIDVPDGLQLVYPETRDVLIRVENRRPYPVMIRLHLAITAPGGATYEHDFSDTPVDAGATKTARYTWKPDRPGEHLMNATLIERSRSTPDRPFDDMAVEMFEVELLPGPTPTTTPPPTTVPPTQTAGSSTASSGGFAMKRALGVAAAGSAVLAALTGAWAWASEPRRYRFLSKLLAFPGLFLFSRIRKDKVLDHETRERIHQAITANPGVHFSGLKRALDLPNGTLVHHLRTLEREGLVKSERVGNRLHFYATGERTRVALGISPRQDIILRSLHHDPGIQQADLARALGVSRQALHQHLTPLRDLGLVQDEAHGRTRRLYLDPMTAGRLATCPGCGSTLFTPGDASVCPSCNGRVPGPHANGMPGPDVGRQAPF